MNYRGVADLNDQIVRSLSSLPTDLDLVVGIPRSGLLVANLLSLHLNLPMTDVDGLIAGRVLRTGSRYNGHRIDDLLSKKRNVFVVDDSVCSGNQMAAVKQRIKQARLPHRIRYGAVYVLPEAHEAGQIDWFAEVLLAPRIFEWNLMHHKAVLSTVFVAIDGVLCRSPLREENDGGWRYGEYVRNASPLYLPTFPVGWLITSRHERYRRETEAWLTRHGVHYDHLIMMPDGDTATPDEAAAAFKAGAYRSTKAQLFIEGSPSQVSRVAELSQKPVFCMETREMMYPDGGTHRTRLPAAGAATLRFTAADQILRLSRAFGHRLLKRAGRLMDPDAAAQLAK